MAKATFKIWRGTSDGGEFKSYDTEISEGMVVLGRGFADSGRTSRRSWLAVGIARRENAVRVRRKLTVIRN